MAIFVKDLLGNGSGRFQITAIVPTMSIASGVTGIISSYTPPIGKKSALMLLACSGTSQQTGISVVIGGVTKIPTATLGGGSGSGSTGAFANNSFCVGAGMPASVVAMLVADDVDQTIQVIKDVGNTTQQVYVAYAYGD